MEQTADLGWLPPLPADFTARAKALKNISGNISDELQALAGHRLGNNELHRLARIVAEARKRDGALAGLTSLRVGLLSNGTTDFVVPAIVGSGLRHGLAIECVTGAFGQFMQDALDPNSVIN